MVIKDEVVLDMFRKNAVNGRITCSECLQIAREMRIDTNEIASTLTEMDIKIVKCQLGCFQ